MSAFKRRSVVFATACALIVPFFVTSNAQAYPPRQRLTVTPDRIVLQAKTGSANFTVRHACPGAARVLVNHHGYKAINASKGHGTFTFGKVKPGKYIVTVKSCKERADVAIYVPGAFVIPQRQVVQRPLAMRVKYAPPGSVVSFLLKKRPVPKMSPIISSPFGVASFIVPANTFKLSKNPVTFMVGTGIKLSGTIKGINAQKPLKKKKK